MTFSARTRAAVAASAAGVLLGGLAVAIPAGADSPEKVGLRTVGAIADHGYPSWYGDANGLRLEPCLDGDNPLCGFAGEFTGQASFPDNFPDEMFYMLAGSEIESGTIEAGLTLAVEGAWSNAQRDGDQIVFGRVRVRVEGLAPGETYTVTHPYGTDEFEATADDRNINFTEDIGIAKNNFTAVFDSRIGPFLQWHPTLAPPPPAGYVGDPNVEEQVTGSPFGTNFFRIVGPNVGAGAPTVNQCFPLPAGVLPQDCLQSVEFSLMGKKSTNAGVSADQAFYTPGAGGGTVTLYASTDEGEALSVENVGTPFIARRQLDGSDGLYVAKVPYTGAPPSSLTVTNSSDVPASRATVKVVDDVDVANASWTTNAAGRKILALRATSSDPTAVLTIEHPTDGADSVVPSNGIGRLLDLQAPPATITVVSDKGGSETAEVAPTMAETAVLAPVPNPAHPALVQPSSRITLDATGSTGMGTLKYEWAQVPVAGEPVLFTGVRRVAVTSMTAPAAGAYAGDLHFSLKVSDDTGLSTTRDFVVTVDEAKTPLAVTPARVDAVVGSTVELDASASENVARYTWRQIVRAGHPTVDLVTTNSDPVATFTMPSREAMPANGAPLEFRLTVRGGDLTTVAHQDVKVYPVVDQLAIGGAEHRDVDDLRIDGTSSVVTGNAVTLTLRQGTVSATLPPIPVEVDGSWRYRGPVPPGIGTAGLVLDATSTASGRVTGFPVEIG